MPSFGERLKREREQRGVTLDDISVATKISVRMLRALEQDQFDQLPGGIFNKGFVRAYAQQLHLDEDELVADYLLAAGGPVALEPPEPVPQIERATTDTSSGIQWRMFAALAVLALIGFMGLRHYSRTNTAESAPTYAARLDASPRSTPQPGSTAAVVIPAVKKSTGRFTVLIKAREECWISITADGKPPVEYTLTGASEKTIEADDRLVIKAGNMGALDLSFDGNAIPPQGDYGEVKTLSFDRNGLRPTPQSAVVGISAQP